MARPTDGWKHVDRLAADAQAKRRLRVVLEVLGGQRSVPSACRELGVGEARFHELRRLALEAAAAGLAPKKVGRPRRPPPEEPGELDRLRRETFELKEALYAAQVREEIALTMPHLLKRRRGKKRRRR